MKVNMNKRSVAWCLLLVIGLGGCASFRPVDRPIVFDETREALSLAYMKDRYGLEKARPTIEPRMVVVHYTVIPTLEGTFRAFNPSRLPGHREAIKRAGALNVSSHFVVDRDGTIYRLLPDTLFARHVIGLNHCAIGIENIGDGKDLPLTDAQLAANAKIVRYLAKTYEIDYLIGHHEYQAFEGHELWLEKDEGYRTRKSDPGPEFMQRLRAKVRGLDLEGPPNTP